MSPRGTVRDAMRTLVLALVLSTASLAGAQAWIAPSQGFGGRAVPGTAANPYIVYENGFPTAQLNTPQVNPAAESAAARDAARAPTRQRF